MSKMKENIIIAVSVSICALFVTTIALLALWAGCPRSIVAGRDPRTDSGAHYDIHGWTPEIKSPSETQKNSSLEISEIIGFEDISATVSYQQKHAILTPTHLSTTLTTADLTSTLPTQSTIIDIIDSESILENSASGPRFPDFEVEPDQSVTETVTETVTEIVTEESDSDLVLTDLMSHKISKKTRKNESTKQQKYLSKINGKWKRFDHDNAKKLFKILGVGGIKLMVMLNAMPQIELDVTENEFRMTVRTMVFVTERVTKAVFPIGEKYTTVNPIDGKKLIVKMRWKRGKLEAEKIYENDVKEIIKYHVQNNDTLIIENTAFKSANGKRIRAKFYNKRIIE